MPAKVEPTSLLPGLSPAAGKPLIARFDGGQLSSDGGLLALREVEQRLGLAERLAACIDDPRASERVRHGLADILRFRMLMIAAGYADGNDADCLRHDPVFKLALNQLPDGAALCSQPTISRLENLPDLRALLRMARAMVGLYCASFRRVPRRIVLDLDDTFDAVHGEQQLRLFNAYYDEYGFQPIVVFDGEGRPVAAMLRPARRPSRAEGLDFVLGVAATSTLRRHVEALEQSTAARRAAIPGTDKLRRYKEFYDGAGSWSRVERIIACVEAGAQGTDTRFVVTNLGGGTARRIYEDLYCQRGQAENHIKAWRLHLAADRFGACPKPCSKASANQLRLMLHTGAYWRLWSLRSLMPKRSTWRAVQFDTLRLRLVKIATRVVALKSRVMLHLPSACPNQAILRLALQRLPRLNC